MRGAVAAQKLGVFARYVDEIYRYMWAEPKKMDDPDVLRAALAESRFDFERLLALAQTTEAKEELRANTEHSVARGAFAANQAAPEDGGAWRQWGQDGGQDCIVIGLRVQERATPDSGGGKTLNRMGHE